MPFHTTQGSLTINNKTVDMLFHTRQGTLTINESLTNIDGDTIHFSTHKIYWRQH